VPAAFTQSVPSILKASKHVFIQSESTQLIERASPMPALRASCRIYGKRTVKPLLLATTIFLTLFGKAHVLSKSQQIDGLDLVPTSFSFSPTTTIDGGTLTYSFTVRNNGTSTAPATTSGMALVVAGDPTVCAGSTLSMLNEAQTPSLAPGESVSQNITFTLPANTGLAPHSWTVALLVDRYSVAGEIPSAQCNNLLVSPQQLVITSAPLPTVLVPYQSSEYRFQTLAQGETPPAGFEQTTFDDSAWTIGAAAFGFSTGLCSLEPILSQWPANSDLFVRKWFSVPQGATNLKIMVAVDNDVQAIFFNGVQVSGPMQHENCPGLDDFQIEVPDALVHLEQNLVVYHLRDRGAETFFDTRITGFVVTPTPNQPPTVGFTMTIGSQSATEGQTLNITAPTGPVFINFSADRSSDADGSVTGWDWKIDGSSVSNASDFTYGLNHGTHTVSLVVTDNQGAISPAVSGQIIIRTPPLCTVTDSGPADSVTRLIADENDTLPLGDRTPLILIHGIHGNKPPHGTDSISNPYRDYFKNFLNYFNMSNFKARYKIYRFHYVSDQFPVSQIARSLRNYVDSQICADTNFDKPIVIVAHSMGGLVARSYMNQFTNDVGIYADTQAGERVLKLITLATPHHGAPGTNADSRDDMATFGWGNVLNLGSVVYWNLQRPDGELVPTRPYNQPNRSDLLWDNFDNVVSSSNVDINGWLSELNRQEQYSSKTIVYYGYVNLEDPTRKRLVSRYNAEGNLVRFDRMFSDAIVANKKDDDHAKLQIANIVIDYGMKRLFALNDGLVPVESGSFRGSPVSLRVACVGFDHLDMKEESKRPCNNRLTLFQSISRDLGVAP
jgi:pimeloyl-ACP methyl ester carboxylesterase